MTLLEWIENHLKEQQISATRFGRQAVGDPRFVIDLRNGRKPRRKTVMKLEAYLTELGCCGSRAALADVQVADLPCAVPGRGGGNGNSIPAVHALQLRHAVPGGTATRAPGGEGDRR